MILLETTIIKLLVPSFASSRGCRGRELGSIDDYYNLLLYIVAATSDSMLFHLCRYKLLADSSPMLQDIVGRLLVFDRPSIFSLLSLYFYLAVHYTASPISIDNA